MMLFELLKETIQSGKIDQVLELLQKDIPSKLYKYVWLDGSSTDELKYSSLKQEQLWVSSIDRFNDPFEFKGLYVDSQEFREHGLPEDIIKRCITHLENYKTYGACALSATSLGFLPMWAYYTNNHQGFCIEYDVTKPTHIYEVIYSSEKQSAYPYIVQLEDELNKSKTADPTFNPLRKKCASKMIALIMLMKSENWQHEKEFRVVYPLPESSNGLNVPIEKLGLKTSRIIAGYNCTPEAQTRLNQISQKLIGNNITKIVLSNDSFAAEEEIVL